MSGKHFMVLQCIFRWGGMAIIAFTIYLIADNAIFRMRADSATGVVIAQEEMEGSQHVPYRERRYRESAYAPHISFKTEAGEMVIFLSNIGYGRHFAYQNGDEVPVLYLRSDPESAMINSLLEMLVLPLVLFVFGGVFWVVGIFVRFMSEPNDKTQRRSRINV